MKQTYADVLHELPVDETLKRFLLQQSFPIPPTIDWSTDDLSTTYEIRRSIENHPDSQVRDKVIAGLQTVLQLNHERAASAIFQAVKGDGAAIQALTACKSDLHRAFWLLVNIPDKFERATDVDYVDHNFGRTQQIDLGISAPVRRDDVSMNNFCREIQRFYQAELNCGDVVVGHLMDREHGTQLVTIHAKDLAKTTLEFDGNSLQRRIGNPTIHMAIEYSQQTKTARTLIKGGDKYNRMLAEAFAEHLLGRYVNAKRLKAPALDLSKLRTGFHVQNAVKDGFAVLQLKSISLLSPDDKLKVECTAMASVEQKSVTELLATHFPRDNPIEHRWMIQSATINLYYDLFDSKQRTKPVVVEVTSRGRLNLHKYDAALRKQLEGYLVEVGILSPDQALDMREVD